MADKKKKEAKNKMIEEVGFLSPGAEKLAQKFAKENAKKQKTTKK